MFTGCGAGGGIVGHIIDDNDISIDLKKILAEILNIEENGPCDKEETYTYKSADGTNLVVDKTGAIAGQSPVLAFSTTSVTLNEGASQELTFTIKDDTEIAISITTGNESIAIGSLTTSTNTLKVQGISEGVTAIVVTIVDESNNTTTETINVTVNKVSTTNPTNVNPVVAIDSTDVAMNVNDTKSVTITATDSDGTISALNIVPDTTNAYANITINKGTLGTATVTATVSIIATTAGSFDLVAVATDNSGGTFTKQITITISSTGTTDPTNPTDPTGDYDPNACISTGYTIIEDNSFDPEGRYDYSNGIAVKSFYPMSFNPQLSLVKLYYKASDAVKDEGSWKVFYDSTTTYYVSYTDSWLAYPDNTVYVKTPTGDCYKLVLNSDSISNAVKVTSTN